MTPNPFPVPPPAPPPKPSGRKTVAIVALVLLTPLVLCLLIGGLALFFEGTAKSGPLRPGDLAALVTAEDLLTASGSQARIDATLEKKARRSLIDGSAELTYEYESESPPLFVSATVTLEKDLSDALTTYTSQAVGGAVGLTIAGQGMKVEDRNELMKYGDQSKAQLLSMNGKPVGNLFITRKGTRVFLVIFSGVYFDDPQAFSELLSPKLAALEGLER